MTPASATAGAAVASPLPTGLLMARIACAAGGTPGRLRRFVQASPLLLAAAIAWSAGELAGHCSPQPGGAVRVAPARGAGS